MLPAALALRDVRVHRGGRVALDVPELCLAPGESLALMGPNGAGKSTLLEVAGLLRRPDVGELLVGGERVTPRRERALRRRMAVVFQAALLFDVPAIENVAAGLRFRGTPRREAERRALGWLERFGVAHLAGRSGRALSGGEAQRVSLARAFAVEPEILLLDEPFAALDAPTRIALIPDLARELRAGKIAAMIVSHDRSEAFALADRLAVLVDGRIAQIGPPKELVASPVNPTVAALLAPEQLLRGD
jgi:tungstate transport system ATP-binding protein